MTLPAKISRFSGIGGHHSNRAATVEWLTPPETIAPLGPFDLDPCAPIVQPYPTAARTFTILDDGLSQQWDGRVWLNPPYANGVVEKWLARLAEHGRGTALIFARTETDAFFRWVWERAAAVLFMRGRINFHVGEAFSVIKTRRTFLAGDKADGNAGAPTVLCAYGADDADILAECGIEGQFVPLIFPRGVLVATLRDVTWREALTEFLSSHAGPISLTELYRAFADHPKAQKNPHWRDKLRQTLQKGAGKRIARGQWAAA